MKKTIALASIALVALAGCASPNLPEVEEASLPAPTLSVTTNESLADILLPPTPTTTLESIEGLLPPSTEWQPAPAPWQVDLPEVENLPPLPEN